MATKLEQLASNLQTALGDKVTKQITALGEVTVECKAADYLVVCQVLRDDAKLKFEQLIDLCGVDYQEYAGGTYEGLRYAVVSHLLSVTLNQRLRLRVFAQDEDFPVLPTLVDLWPVANWFEREAFDLYRHHV